MKDRSLQALTLIAIAFILFLFITQRIILAMVLGAVAVVAQRLLKPKN